MRTGLIGTRLFSTVKERHWWRLGFCRPKVGLHHQEIDARAAANTNPGAPHPFPTSILFGMRNSEWWDRHTAPQVMGRRPHAQERIHGGHHCLSWRCAVSAIHVERKDNSGPYFHCYASRSATSDLVQLDQSRTSNYQSIFFKDLVRIGKFHNGFGFVPP